MRLQRPWSWRPDDDEAFVVLDVEGLVVCHVATAAEARLIAEAPTMCELLEAAYGDQQTGMVGVRQDARSSLARAAGLEG